MEFTRQQISDYEDFKTEQLHKAVINEAEHQKSRGWVKLDGKPTYEEIATRSYANVAATEKEIKRLEKKIDKLGDKKQELMNESTGCFLPGTGIKLQDGSLLPLSEIKPGQTILTYDIGYEKTTGKKVVQTYKVKANHLYKINNQLTTTGGERLLTPKGWVKIRDLKKGDFVHANGKMVKIERIEYIRTKQTLYNMEIADTHNFYVVTPDGDSYLVHNSSGGHGGGSSGSNGGSSGGGVTK